MQIFRNQKGDTIVEVLIAITVVAAVLGGSYTVVNRTMANSRQAQEHAEALQIANKQVEYIGAIAGSGSSGPLFGTTQYKCISKTTGEVVGQPSLGGPLEDSSEYVAACREDSPAGYRTAFEYVASGRYFKVYVTWPSVTGDGNDQVSVVYRPYQP